MYRTNGLLNKINESVRNHAIRDRYEPTQFLRLLSMHRDDYLREARHFKNSAGVFIQNILHKLKVLLSVVFAVKKWKNKALCNIWKNKNSFFFLPHNVVPFFHRSCWRPQQGRLTLSCGLKRLLRHAGILCSSAWKVKKKITLGCPNTIFSLTYDTNISFINISRHWYQSAICLLWIIHTFNTKEKLHQVILVK